jgi:hypothetical protein
MGWITSYPTLELVIVMFLVPVIMNALAFWVQDNVLMKKSDKAKKNESDSEVKPQDEVFLGSVDNSIGNSLL